MHSFRKKMASLIIAFMTMITACFSFMPASVYAASSPVSMTLTPSTSGFTVKVTSTKSFSSMGATHLVISGPNLYKVYTAKSDLSKSSMTWNITLPETDTRLDTYTFTVKKIANESTTILATVSKTGSFLSPVSNLKAAKYGTGLKISWSQASKFALNTYISVYDNTSKTTVYSTSVGRSTNSTLMSNYNPKHSYTVSVKNKNKAGYYSMTRTYKVLAAPKT